VVDLKQTVRNLREGKYRWGTVEAASPVDMGRRGWGRYRLVVFPPGTNSSERQALSFRRRWPLIGAVIGLVAEAVLGSFLPAGLVTIAVLLGYAGGIIVAFVVTRQFRGRLRTVTVVMTMVGGETRVYGQSSLLSSSLATLEELDRAMGAGELTEIEYELGWASVYDAIGAEPADVIVRSGMRQQRPETGVTSAHSGDDGQ
jgi:hypothetical protein